MKKQDKTLPLTLLGATFLIIVGTVAGYILISSEETVDNLPVGAEVVPKDAMMTLHLSTDSTQWENLQQFGTPESKAALQKLLGQLRDRFLTTYGYNYQRDIQPWVGKEVAIAFLRKSTLEPSNQTTPDSPPPPPAEQATMVVLPITNPTAAKQILDKPRSPKAGKLVKRTYRGIEITETEGVPNQDISVAALGGKFLVVTNSQTAINRAVDIYKGDQSLAKAPGYTAAMEKLETAAPFAQVYVNIPVAAAYTSSKSMTPVSEENLKQLEDNQGVAAKVSLVPEGIDLKAISWLKPNSQKKFTVENKATEMLSRVPGNALMMISGSNLQRMWSDYVKGAAANPIAPINPDTFRQTVKNGTGMDLDKEFINWMAGEYSLSLLPIPKSKDQLQKFAAGFVFMVKASDRRAAEESLKKLDEVMKKKEFEVGEAVASGKPVVKWTSPFGGFTVIRGWLNGNVAFFTLGGSVENQILPAPTNSMAESVVLQETLPLESESFNGNFFIDISRTFNPQNLSIPQLPANQKIWVDGMESIGVTSIVSNSRTTNYDVFVKLKKQEL
ncbi:MAG: DUF3352 domain-containing protein [Okeania sp. SIO2F4]|uniref:DUF3352 domain-containing protein n=1 Tax=Okeania sp. SIO2F4 TaxID=2607790 RepID=UPI00142AAF57|nr:DUF3352 domain-containing protein [Okeania sp. SIO2F4]NES02186.1 DUF3352 domain-containing protein [Okeania sp. SIO2F4]